MKILHTVEYYQPSVGGAQEVVRQISERLVQRGHEVKVATTVHPGRSAKIINGVRIAEFDIKGNSVHAGRTGSCTACLFGGTSGRICRCNVIHGQGWLERLLTIKI